MAAGKKSLFFWSGLGAMLVLYFLYYFYFINDIAHEVPLRGRHLIKLLFILTCYGIGVFALGKFAGGWVVRLWHMVYLVCLFLMLGLGIYDWAVARTPLPVRMVADNLQEFLVSPLLYVAMGLFSLYLKGL